MKTLRQITSASSQRAYGSVQLKCYGMVIGPTGKWTYTGAMTDTSGPLDVPPHSILTVALTYTESTAMPRHLAFSADSQVFRFQRKMPFEPSDFVLTGTGFPKPFGEPHSVNLNLVNIHLRSHPAVRGAWGNTSLVFSDKYSTSTSLTGEIWHPTPTQN
ncbi:hypothetical protein NMY22_g198 [Coprinellus aureogranulatus]|nr:hypothetical protein NMY22_g198 [Coprinellus aureogranulatus]